ncbi:MAG: hypothetical protein ACTHK2_12990 [Dokdonella sp.]|uniref:hypothetical protein n=1 Tax=Dokdonella sp. TaxID=2291710 RepID=UPI003F7F2821
MDRPAFQRLLRARVLAAFFAAAERLDEVRLLADVRLLVDARLPADFFGARPAGDFRAELRFAGVFFADVFLADVFFAAFLAVFFFAAVPFAPPSCLLTVAHARFCAVFFETPRFS